MIQTGVLNLKNPYFAPTLAKIFRILTILAVFLLFCESFSFLVRTAEANYVSEKAKIKENIIFSQSSLNKKEKKGKNTAKIANIRDKVSFFNPKNLQPSQNLSTNSVFLGSFSGLTDNEKVEITLNKDFFNFSSQGLEEEEKVLRSFFSTITAYNSEASQCDSSPCITANGYNVCKYGREDTVAVNHLSFGTKVKIPELFGDRVFIVRDRMNSKHANRLDVWMVDKGEALNFGIKQAKIEVLE